MNYIYMANNNNDNNNNNNNNNDNNIITIIIINDFTVVLFLQILFKLTIMCMNACSPVLSNVSPVHCENTHISRQVKVAS